jgi:hypothetical protein
MMPPPLMPAMKPAGGRQVRHSRTTSYHSGDKVSAGFAWYFRPSISQPFAASSGSRSAEKLAGSLATASPTLSFPTRSPSAA